MVEDLTYKSNYLWCTDYNDRTKIYQIDPANGNQISTITKENQRCKGVAWDGTYFWLPSDYFSDDTLIKIDTSGNKIIQFSCPDSPHGCTFVNGYLWIIKTDINKIAKINPADGSIITTVSAPGSQATGLTFDGTYFWCSDQVLDKIYKIKIIE